MTLVSRMFITKILILTLILISQAEMPTVRGYVDFKTENLQNTFYNLLDSNRIKCIKNAIVTKETIAVSSGAISEIYQVRFYMNFDPQYIADRNLIKQSTSTFKLNSNIIGYGFEVWESNNDGVPGQCKPCVMGEVLIK